MNNKLGEKRLKSYNNPAGNPAGFFAGPAMGKALSEAHFRYQMLDIRC